MRDVPHDGQIVRDEEVGDAELFLQLHEQVDHLGLDRDVEGRDGLVADDEPRLDGEGPGDADALPLAAGELVRIAVQEARIEADQVHQAHRLPACDRAESAGRKCCIGSAMMLPTVIRGFSEA